MSRINLDSACGRKLEIYRIKRSQRWRIKELELGLLLINQEARSLPCSSRVEELICVYVNTLAIKTCLVLPPSVFNTVYFLFVTSCFLKGEHLCVGFPL